MELAVSFPTSWLPIWNLNTVANQFYSMYVRLAKVIKTRNRREKPFMGIIKSNRVPYP